MGKLIARIKDLLHNEENVIEIDSLEGKAKLPSLETQYLEADSIGDNLKNLVGLNLTFLGNYLIQDNEIYFALRKETNYILVLTFGGTFTIIPANNLTPSTDYYVSGCFVNENGVVHTGVIKYNITRGNTLDDINISSNDTNNKFINGYTAYLFGIKL